MTDENIFSVIYNNIIVPSRINNKLFSISEYPVIRWYMKDMREQVISCLEEEFCRQRTGGRKAPQGDLSGMFKEQHGSQYGWSQRSKGMSGRKEVRGWLGARSQRASSKVQTLFSETGDFKKITRRISSSCGDTVRLFIERITLAVLRRMNSRYQDRRARTFRNYCNNPSKR